MKQCHVAKFSEARLLLVVSLFSRPLSRSACLLRTPKRRPTSLSRSRQDEFRMEARASACVIGACTWGKGGKGRQAGHTLILIRPRGDKSWQRTLGVNFTPPGHAPGSCHLSGAWLDLSSYLSFSPPHSPTVSWSPDLLPVLLSAELAQVCPNHTGGGICGLSGSRACRVW